MDQEEEIKDIEVSYV